MKKIIRTILMVLVIIFVIIQFFRPAENASAETFQNEITAGYSVPENIQNILKTSCYDCHSNTTVYPWYWHVQPAAWFLNDHIIEGKRHLNFSEFSNYSLRRQYKKLEEIGEEVKSGDMPLWSFTLIHRDAVLSADQKTALETWAENSMKEMESKYPADSLTKKKKTP